MEDKITISKIEYETLLKCSLKYKILKDFIFNSVSLHYNRQSLTLSSSTQLNDFLKVLEPVEHFNILRRLQEKENKENE